MNSEHMISKITGAIDHSKISQRSKPKEAKHLYTACSDAFGIVGVGRADLDRDANA